MKKSSRTWLLLLIPILIIFSVLIYRIPFVYNRLSWRIEDLKTRIIYAINPPDEVIFKPVGDTPLATPFIPSSPDTPIPSPGGPTPTTNSEPIITSTPLPDRVILDGVIYVDQHERWNYCGPANLAMALNYWGWPGDRDDIARIVKPGINDPDLDFIQRGRHDKNVMPSEMINFVAEETDFNIVARFGGDLELLKLLIANGFPVLVEKGYYEEDYTGKVAWLGHYLFTTGYDEAAGEFVVQDAYLKPGKDMRVDYQTYLEGWRSFDYIFMVVYPPDQQDQVLSLLGEWADPIWSYNHALEIAEQEIQTQTGVNVFFAWFN
ncbi:MAG: C39 family peptidase, partial [Anaerolineales bacterium]|nr:C39 family peptidase [Anaerolineales bacterium]